MTSKRILLNVALTLSPSSIGNLEYCPGTYTLSVVVNFPSQWRLIPRLHVSGQLQMAIDTWLLEQHLTGKLPPVLRFYTWTAPTISLGYHQRRWPEAWQQLNWQGQPLELVRRPTGGRAVLHHGDLTYAIVISRLSGKRLDAYHQICQFLIEGWRSLGVELHYGTAGGEYRHNPSCFGTATGADLLSKEGYKFIGSAQVRRNHTILQHGSMRLEPDLELYEQVFGEPAPIWQPLTQQGEALIHTAITALTMAAVSCFGVQLVEQPLSDEEWQEVLAQPKPSV